MGGTVGWPGRWRATTARPSRCLERGREGPSMLCPLCEVLGHSPQLLPVPTRLSAPAPSALDPRTLPGGAPQGRVRSEVTASSEVTARVAALLSAPSSPPPHCFHPGFPSPQCPPGSDCTLAGAGVRLVPGAGGPPTHPVPASPESPEGDLQPRGAPLQALGVLVPQLPARSARLPAVRAASLSAHTSLPRNTPGSALGTCPTCECSLCSPGR